MIVVPFNNFAGAERVVTAGNTADVANGILNLTSPSGGSAYAYVQFNAFAEDVITVSCDALCHSVASGAGLRIALDSPQGAPKMNTVFPLGEGLTRRSLSYQIPVEVEGMQSVRAVFGFYGGVIGSGVMTNPMVTIKSSRTGAMRTLLMGCVQQVGPSVSLVGHHANYGIAKVDIQGTDRIRVYPAPGLTFPSGVKQPLPFVTPGYSMAGTGEAQESFFVGTPNTDGAFDIIFRKATTGAAINIVDSAVTRKLFVRMDV